MTKTYNVLDAAATEIMNQGDAQCVPKKRFTTPWSVPLICASALLHYWSIKISSLKRRSVSSSVLQDAGARGGVQDGPYSLHQAELHRLAARKDLFAKVANAKAIRKQELTERTAQYAAAGNGKMETIIKEILNSEQAKLSWRNIQRTLNTNSQHLLMWWCLPQRIHT